MASETEDSLARLVERQQERIAELNDLLKIAHDDATSRNRRIAELEGLVRQWATLYIGGAQPEVSGMSLYKATQAALVAKEGRSDEPKASQ